VIKALAFNPANKNKTYSQLLDEAYGNALTGRRTIETTTPRGGAKDTKVDMQRAQSDEAFGGRLQKYMEQYQFQMQQMQNAEIGRIGTNPAQMGGVTTPGMQQ